MALANKRYTKDVPFFFQNASRVTYDASGIELVNIEEARVVGLSTSSNFTEVWFRTDWKDLQENITQLPTARQDMTGYFPVASQAGFRNNWMGAAEGMSLRTWKKADGRLPMHITIDFRQNNGAALSHTGVLWLRFICRTAQ